MTPKNRIRLKLAQDAARILAEEGINDFRSAKQKAAQRLGVRVTTANLPDNDEIEQALDEYYRLYHASTHGPHLNKLRAIALEAMQFLDEFSPRLVGPVLEGSASQFSPINLHLFPQTPEEVLLKLMAAQIPFSESSHEVRQPKAGTLIYPLFRFIVDNIEVELRLFPPSSLHQAQKTRNRSIRRASIKEVKSLVENQEACGLDAPHSFSQRSFTAT